MFKTLKGAFKEAKLHYGIGIATATSKLSHELNGLFVDKEFFDAEFFEDLEEKLIELDIVPNLAISLTEKIENRIYNKRVSKDTFQTTLYEVIKETVHFQENNELKLDKDMLNILLVVGINGVGKTTTISKLANTYADYNLELVAADTFRAGAIDQLNEWAKRLDVPITKTHQGHAPSAVIYDGLDSAKKNNRNLLICDTAGRLHNKSELMDELNKIYKIIEKQTEDKTVNKKTILVLDGTGGKNTIEQAKAFNEATELDGVIVTKLDSSSKAGMIINISYELNVPIYFLTNGEQIKDITTFDPETYLNLLFTEE